MEECRGSCFVQGLSIQPANPSRKCCPEVPTRIAHVRRSFAPALGMSMWGFLPPQKDDGIPPPPMVEISKEEEFESLLMQAATVDKLLVLDCYASWCRVCVFLEPRFKKLAHQFMDSCMFVKADGLLIEYNDGKSGSGTLKFAIGIEKYPTFQVWKKRTLVAEIVGAQDFEPRDFERMLRGLILDWSTKEEEPLRLTGVGATKKQFYSKDTHGGGGGGRGDGMSGNGGSSREIGK